MKIFILGLPGSGRSTVAKSISENGFKYIDTTSWIKSEFREPKVNECQSSFDDEYKEFFSKKLLDNPLFIIDRVKEIHKLNNNIIIDGICSPYNFISLFDYREDLIVILNRIDNETDCSDHESIGISVIRDYCFWMASAGLINKSKWIEYNFKIPGEDCKSIKMIGAQNSILLAKSINNVIQHLSKYLFKNLD